MGFTARAYNFERVVVCGVTKQLSSEPRSYLDTCFSATTKLLLQQPQNGQANLPVVWHAAPGLTAFAASRPCCSTVHCHTTQAATAAATASAAAAPSWASTHHQATCCRLLCHQEQQGPSLECFPQCCARLFTVTDQQQCTQAAGQHSSSRCTHPPAWPTCCNPSTVPRPYWRSSCRSRLPSISASTSTPFRPPLWPSSGCAASSSNPSQPPADPQSNKGPGQAAAAAQQPHPDIPLPV